MCFVSLLSSDLFSLLIRILAKNGYAIIFYSLSVYQSPTRSKALCFMLGGGDR